MHFVQRVYQKYLRNSFIWKLKLTNLVVGDVELTRRQYLHHNTTASTPKTTTTTTTITATTTTAIKANTTAIDSTATTITATTVATGAIVQVKKNLQAKNLDNIESVLNEIKTNYAHIGCQENTSAMLQKRLMVLS